MWSLRYRGHVDKPCLAGKVKTFLLFPAVIAMAWHSTGWLAHIPSEQIGLWFLWAAAFFAVWSLLRHNDKVPDVPNPRIFLRRLVRN